MRLFTTLCSVACSSVLTLAPHPLEAQILVGAHAATVTHTEISQTFRGTGPGLGPFLEARVKRFHVHATALYARPSRSDLSFSFTQADVHAGYSVLPVIAFEVGLHRRWIDRVFAGQDVAAMSFGAYSETRLSRTAIVRLRGAYVPYVAFRNGGRIGSSVAIGLGSSLSSRQGTWRAQMDVSLQRFDRQVPGEARPIQTSIARLGLARRWTVDSG